MLASYYQIFEDILPFLKIDKKVKSKLLSDVSQSKLVSLLERSLITTARGNVSFKSPAALIEPPKMSRETKKLVYQLGSPRKFSPKSKFFS